MLEYIYEFADLYALSPIYVGIIIGLILKSLWVWAIDDTSVESFTTRLELTLSKNDRQIQRKSRNIPNPILVWMIKYIRNKSGSLDDLASFVSHSI